MSALSAHSAVKGLTVIIKKLRKPFQIETINKDQTGLIKGLFIGETIILIDGITRYAAEQYIPRLLLFIDFEKAFSSLKWSFVNRTLKSYGV